MILHNIAQILQLRILLTVRRTEGLMLPLHSFANSAQIQHWKMIYVNTSQAQ